MAARRAAAGAATLPVLRRAGASQAFLQDVWRKVRSPQARRVRPCPHCGRRMPQVTTYVGSQSRAGGGQGKALTLDVCKLCASIWFDAAEFESMSHATAPARGKELSPRARQQIAIVRAREIREEAERGSEFTPDHTWQWLPGLLGLPVECNGPPLSKLP